MTSIQDLLAGEDGQTIRSYLDSTVTKAIQTYSSKRPDTSKLAERLHALEETEANRQAEYDMKFHILKKCYESGLDYTLVSDIPFDSIENADRKINALIEFSKSKKSAELNLQMASGFKPGGGSGYGHSVRPDKMSRSEAIAAEENHTLDKILANYGIR